MYGNAEADRGGRDKQIKRLPYVMDGTGAQL